MAFLDNFVIPEQTKSIEPPVTGGGRSSASFLGNFVLPEDTARATKVQSYKESAAELRRQAESQGSVWGMTKAFASEMTVVPVKDFISGAKEGIKSVQAVEPEKIFDVPRTLSIGAEPMVSAWRDVGTRIVDAAKTATDEHKNLLQKGVSVGEAGMGVINYLFSPVTAALTGASTVPVIGHVADKVNELFAAVGAGASKVATDDIVEKLPISRTTKDTVKPLVGEIAALTAQIILGKGSAKLYPHVALKVKELNSKIYTDAVSKVELPSGIAPKGGFLSEFVKPEEKPTESVAAPKEKVLTPEAQKAIAERKVETDKYDNAVIQIKQSEAFPIEKSIASGDIARESVYKDTTSKTLQPDFAQGRIDDVAQKLDMAQKGLGDTYRKQVDSLNTTMEEIVSRGLSVIESATKEGISKVAKSVEAKAIEQGLTKGFGEVAGYEKITIADQARRASDVMSRDFEYATRMVKGEVPMEAGLKPEMLIKAMEDHGIRTKNVRLLQDIANSPLTSATSGHAQALRILAERDPESAVVKMREIKKAREAAAEKKTGKSVDKAKTETVKEVKKAKDSKKVTKQSWQEFISELKCNY